MPSVCFYFQVHQPFRIKKYRIFDIGQDHQYFEDHSESNLNNKKIFQKVAKKCYLPANEVFYELLQKYPQLKLSFSFSGIFLDACETFYPELLHSFQKLVKTGKVEVLSETYYHSLSFLYSPQEFQYGRRLAGSLLKPH